MRCFCCSELIYKQIEREIEEERETDGVERERKREKERYGKRES